MSRFSRTYRALRPWLHGYAKLDQRIDRARSAIARFAEGFVLSGLDAAEQADLTIGIYDRRDRHPAALFAWERPWFEATLPKPPARVLVGGAGDGREVRAIRELGYDVDAFEPAPRSLSQLSAAVGSGAALLGSHEDLIRACSGEPNTLTALAAQRYDAMLLGWTSLSHVLDPRDRRALFEACRTLCPRGPILASFFFTHEAASTRGGRARAWGAALGNLVGNTRGLERSPSTAGVDQFLVHAGVVHIFDRAELEALSDAIDRTLVFDPLPYAHATWLAH